MITLLGMWYLLLINDIGNDFILIQQIKLFDLKLWYLEDEDKCLEADNATKCIELTWAETNCLASLINSFLQNSY